MKKLTFNIIIPSIKIDQDLLLCLKKINYLKNNNFFVTIILDSLNYKLDKKNYNYKIQVTTSKNKNMSAKRNFAAKKYESTHLAFLDSDAYPNYNWLTNASKYFKKYGDIILGGPNIPFPNQQKNISHLSKRSFFLNGHLAYRKYMSKKKFINDWLESCNFMIPRNLYIKLKGMDENIYIGEDQKFFKTLKRSKNKIKILFCPSLNIFHNERSYINLLLQRFSFGMDVLKGVSFDNGVKGTLVSLPLILLICIMTFFIFIDLDIIIKFKYFLIFLGLINIFILIEISKYIYLFKNKILTLISINLLNLVYALGGLATIFGLKKIIQKKIYRNSR